VPQPETIAEQSMSDTITNNDEIVEITEVTEVIELIDPMQEDAPIIEQEQELSGESIEMEDEPAPVTSDLNMEEGPSVVPDTSQSQEATEDTVEGSSEVQATRTTVMVNGRPVDITGTGIDPTFLEALPDDLREEVLNQNLPPERRNRPPVTSGTGDAITSLPPAIVAEANALRERASRRYTNAVRSRTLTAPQIQVSKKPSIQRDAVKLVDTSGLATL
ncbi:1022_t:CDS:2, partial [Racocetra persica]